MKLPVVVVSTDKTSRDEVLEKITDKGLEQENLAYKIGKLICIYFDEYNGHMCRKYC